MEKLFSIFTLLVLLTGCSFFQEDTLTLEEISKNTLQESSNNPDNWLKYENKTLGIKFEYLESWGEVIEETELVDVNMRITLSFSKSINAKIITQTPNYRLGSGINNDVIHSYIEWRKQGNLPQGFCYEIPACNDNINKRGEYCDLRQTNIDCEKQKSKATIIARSEYNKGYTSAYPVYFIKLEGDLFLGLVVNTVGTPTDQIQKLVNSIEVFKPIKQEKWYKDLVRKKLNIKPINIDIINQKTAKSESINTTGTGNIIINKEEYESYSKKSAIELTGAAGTNITKITVRHLCENEIYIGEFTVLRPPNTANSAWNWNYTIGSNLICNGQNLVLLIPDTCSNNSIGYCKESKNFSFYSEVGLLNPNSIKFLSDLNLLGLSPQEEKTYKGIAGANVESIEVHYGNECYRGFNSIQDGPILIREDSSKGEWEFTYTYKDICKGYNFVDFRPNTCPEKGYSSACGVRESHQFNSDVGRIKADQIVLARDYDSYDNYYSSLKDANEVKFKGFAGKSVENIYVITNCDDLSLQKKDVIKRPVNILSGEEWQWEYILSTDKKTICRGSNKIEFRYKSEISEYETDARFEFESNIGYITPETEIQSELILQNYTGHHQIVNNEIKPIILNVENKQFINFCAQDWWDRQKDDGTKSGIADIRSPISHTINLNEQLSAYLRTPTTDELKDKNTSQKVLLDFKKIPEAIGNVPVPLEIITCNPVNIYYINENRIIVNLGTGFETPERIFVWNGTEWLSLYSYVNIGNPVTLGPINKRQFVISETRSCCSDTQPKVFRSWSDFVIDVDTLKMIDVISRGNQM